MELSRDGRPKRNRLNIGISESSHEWQEKAALLKHQVAQSQIGTCQDIERIGARADHKFPKGSWMRCWD